MTTLLESFNTADSDTLGPDQTWAEDSGDFDIVSNKARLIGAGSVARITTNLATDNHYVQAKINADLDSHTSGLGIIARKAGSATATYYLFDGLWNTDVVRCFRTVAGAFTAVGSTVATTLSANTQYLFKLQCIGSNILGSVDGVSKINQLDSGITGNLQIGLRGDLGVSPPTDKDWDELEAADIASVGHRASTAGTGNTSTSVAIVIPAATQADDIVIAAYTNGGATTDPSVADDDTGGNAWAKVLSGDDGGSNLSVWWKRATSATASKTVTATGFTNSCTGVVSVYSGALTSGNPYAGQTYQSNASGTESHAAITPTVDGSMVFLVVGNQPDLAISTEAATSPAVLLERGEHLSTGGADSSVALASEVQVTAGSTGALTWAQTNSASMSIAFYLTPQASGPTTVTGAGSAAGTSTAAAVGKSTWKAAGSAAGTSTAAADGQSTNKAVGAATGTSTATAEGQAVKAGDGAAAGTSTAAAVGKSTAKAAGSAAGTSTAAADGQSTNKAAGSADGTSTATAVGQDANAASVGSAAGTSTATAIARAFALAGGMAAGASTAAAIASAVNKAIGLATGTSTAEAVGEDAAGAPGLNDGDDVQVIQAGGIECSVYHDNGTLVSVVTASATQISVVQAGGTPIRVTI